MGRRTLAPGEGLWLPTDASIHMLFMRFAIDAVFLAAAEEGPPAPAGASTATGSSPSARTLRRSRPEPTAWQVVAIREHLRPWVGVVWFVRGARGCLELEAGAAARAGLRRGDTVRFEAASDGPRGSATSPATIA